MMLGNLIVFVLFIVASGNSMSGNFQTCNFQCSNDQTSEPESPRDPPQHSTLFRGKAGPRGAKGEDGHPGKTGEQGRDCNQSAIDTRITQLESGLNNQMQTLSTELNETKAALIASNVKNCGMLQLPSQISNGQITASSNRDNYHGSTPRHGRLFSTSGEGAWFAGTKNRGEWIQVDLGENVKIFSIATQGRLSDYNDWVTSYSVSYKTDGGSFRNVNDQSGAAVIFQGNTDLYTVVLNDLPEPVTARFFRIQPVTFVGWTALRFDVITC